MSGALSSRGARRRRHDRSGDRPRPRRVGGGRLARAPRPRRARAAARWPTRTAAARPTRRARSTPARASPTRSRMRRARQLRQLPRQPRRDARLPAGRLPLHRPRRPLLDDRAGSSSSTRVRARRACWRCSAWARAPGKTNVMAVRRGARAAARTPRSGCDVIARPAGTSTRPAGFSVPYALADAGRRADDARRWCSADGDAGRDRAARPTAARSTSASRSGRRETIYTLHSEMRTFGESFGCREASFRLSLAPALLERAARADRGPEDEVERTRARGAAALGAARSRCTWSRRAATGARCGSGR